MVGLEIPDPLGDEDPVAGVSDRDCHRSIDERAIDLRPEIVGSQRIRVLECCSLVGLRVERPVTESGQVQVHGRLRPKGGTRKGSSQEGGGSQKVRCPASLPDLRPVSSVRHELVVRAAPSAKVRRELR